jgi:hypothetical protein
MNRMLENFTAQGELVGYFGYGSLVNRLTLTTRVVAAFPVRLRGWRRTWRPRPDMGAEVAGGLSPSLLTAHRAPESAIDGLLVIDRSENLPSIDAREFRYHRRDLSMTDFEFQGPAPDLVCDLHVYEARAELPPVPEVSPILRSYLDAVMQGFLREFGEPGLHRFVAETDAFHTPIHEDRHAPLYPRAVTLSAEEIALFDRALSQVALPPGD